MLQKYPSFSAKLPIGFVRASSDGGTTKTCCFCTPAVLLHLVKLQNTLACVMKGMHNCDIGRKNLHRGAVWWAIHILGVALWLLI